MTTRVRRIRRRVAGAWILQPLTGVWLVVLWLLLWGRVSLGLTASGIVVAALVMLAFPLTPIAVEGRLRPWSALRFGTRFAGDVLLASVQVAWLAVRPGPEPETAVIAVGLRTRSDLMLTLVAEALGLVPGSMVVEVDRRERTLYLHLIGVRDRAAVERERLRVHALEARMIRAFGSPDDRAALARDEEAR